MTDPRTGALRGASFATLAITGALAAAPAHAGAFYLADQSTKATGRAYSGEVSEQGAQQQYYNPAAIGGIDSLQSYFARGAALMERRTPAKAKVAPKLMVRVSFAAVLSCILFKDWMFPAGIASEQEISDAIIDFVLDGITVDLDPALDK